MGRICDLIAAGVLIAFAIALCLLGNVDDGWRMMVLALFLIAMAKVERVDEQLRQMNKGK